MTTIEAGRESAAAPVSLRLQKKAEVRGSGRASRLGFIWRTAVLAILVLAAAAGLWKGSRALDNDPRFRLHHLELSGAQYVEQSEVEDVFAADRDHSLMRIPLAARRRALEQIPWVRSASIIRILPDQILVQVQERTPVAYVWTRRGVELMDSQGVILDAPPYASFPLPVVRGVSEQDSPQQRLAKMQRFMALSGSLSPSGGPLPEPISEVELGDPQDLQVIVTGPYGAIRLHLGNGKFQQRYQVFLAQIEQWIRQFGQIDSIDLQFDGQAVVHAAASAMTPGSKAGRGSNAASAGHPVKPARPASRATRTSPTPRGASL